jgi:hypothetical protein
MTYRCASFGLAAVGLTDCDTPRITCDGCQAVINIRGLPPEWFLDGKPKRGWSIVRDAEGMRVGDYCPTCTRKQKAKR